MARATSWAMFSTGASLIVYAFVVALEIRGDLQTAHHARSTTASALSSFPLLQLETVTSAAATVPGGSSLPVTVIVAALVGGLLVLIGGIGALFSLQPIQRSQYAKKLSFENEVFTGYDFAHFNHRGRAQHTTPGN
jgi:hypothetical protein